MLPQKTFWQKFRPYFFPALAMLTFFVVTGYLVFAKMVPAVKQTGNTLTSIKKQISDSQKISSDALNALTKNPPAHTDSGLTTKTVNNGKTVVVSEGQVSADTVNQLNSLSTSTVGTPYDITFNDTTGAYGYLVQPLKTYMATSLLWSKREIGSLYLIRFVDAGASGWSGMYNGGYSMTGNTINKVSAYIDLNVYYYKTSPYLLQYLELTLSHEYGHHFSLYNKWMSSQLGFGTRFPDSYYKARGLSYDTTAPDYSKGWASCDAEIVAEDYKYLFSPFKDQQMAATYGYPPDPAVRNWFLSYGQINSASDTQAPTVSITSPTDNATLSGSVNLVAAASDNVAVATVEYKLNDTSLGSAVKNNNVWQLGFNSLSVSNGSFALKAIACDQAGNCTTASNTVIISNTLPDLTPPTVNITSPSDGQTVSGAITFSANVSDNVKVASTSFYIDNTLLNTKTIQPYSTQFNTLSYTNGPHQLKVVASDGQNSADQTISVNIDNGDQTDTEKPQVTITAPSTNPYTWVSGDLTITALATDNVGVVKIEFYIDDSLVATDNSTSLARRWVSRGTPAGTYTLKAKAYDAAGNSAETSVAISKQ